ncbi:hypothetical protein LZ30DRAFT_93242 [Colletotrichum cereale]|nr:hypothetical protein LZ30DRAFT_93242 [Colletotrichum cereale]
MVAMSLWHVLVLGPASTLALGASCFSCILRPLPSVLSYPQPNSNVRRSSKHAYSCSVGLNKPGVPVLLRSCVMHRPDCSAAAQLVPSSSIVGMYGMVRCGSAVRLDEEERGDRHGLIFNLESAGQCRQTVPIHWSFKNRDTIPGGE